MPRYVCQRQHSRFSLVYRALKFGKLYCLVKAHLTTGPELLCESNHSNAAKSIVGGLPLICHHTIAEFSYMCQNLARY